MEFYCPYSVFVPPPHPSNIQLDSSKHLSENNHILWPCSVWLSKRVVRLSLCGWLAGSVYSECLDAFFCFVLLTVHLSIILVINQLHAQNLHVCTVHQWRLKHFIIQQINKYIIVYTIRIIIKYLNYLKLLQHVSNHKRSIVRELYTALG